MIDINSPDSLILRGKIFESRQRSALSEAAMDRARRERDMAHYASKKSEGIRAERAARAEAGLVGSLAIGSGLALLILSPEPILKAAGAVLIAMGTPSAVGAAGQAIRA